MIRVDGQNTRYTFEGPYPRYTSGFLNNPGVYLIISEEQNEIVDVKETDKIRESIEKDYQQYQQCQFAVYYDEWNNRDERVRIVKDIKKYNALN